MTAPPAIALIDLACSLQAAGHPGRALAVLDLALSDDTLVTDALAMKGNLLRSRGELRQAAEAFDLLARRDPDHPCARYLSELLSGSSPPLPLERPAPWPAVFVRLEQYLDRGRRDRLLELVTSPESVFEPSTVGAMGANGREPRVDLDCRASLRLTDIGPVAVWMRARIRADLPSIGARLGVAPFAVAEIELKCTAYRDGHYFSVHSDSLHQPTRRISFVYYFHHLPKRYSGGALLLYDRDVTDPARYFPDRVTRLETLDNSVVFFPSGAFHEVVPVVSPSGRFEDARFTLAGHVHAVDGNHSTIGTSGIAG